MLRRLPTHIRSVASALLLLGFAASVQASSSTTLVNFELANTGTTNVSRIDFSVIPAGAVTPPVIGTDSSGQPQTGSPVALISNSGFDSNYFSVALGDKPGAQVLRFLFGQAQTVDSSGNVTFSSILDSSGNPIGSFAPGAKMDFSVSVNSTVGSQLRLQIISSAAGLTLNQLSNTVPVVATTNSSSTSGQGTTSTTQTAHQTQVPEPMSVIVWGSLIGLGLTRARLFRKVA